MLFYTLRVREQILDIMDKTCGARMTFNYETIGGVIADLDPDFVKDVKALLEILPKNIKEYNKLFTGNVITRNRMEGVGVLSRKDAISWAITGPSGRASGWACDVRKTAPYAVYDEVEFDEIVRTEGDSMARFKVRMDEMEQSARIIAQLIDKIPDGRYRPKCQKYSVCPRVAGIRQSRVAVCIRHIYRERRRHIALSSQDSTSVSAVGCRSRSSDRRLQNRRPYHHRRLA